MALVWCNAGLEPGSREALDRAAGRHRVVFPGGPARSILEAGPTDDSVLDADIVFGQPDPAVLMRSARVRWVQITTAGFTRYDTGAFRDFLAARACAFTNSSSVFDEACAEHALALMLGFARQTAASAAAQALGEGWRSDRLRPRTSLLRGSRVVLLGFGAIGRRLARLLAPFGCAVVAVRRSPRPGPLPEIGWDRAADALTGADHVINLLPESDATRGICDRAFFQSLRPGAHFYNIGRGATVDSAALLAALVSGHLAGAGLDVTDPEPLPAGDPLWTAPNCWITPHIAGGYAGENLATVEHFAANLRRFFRGTPLRDRVW
jgi:phosphoglycerate dehydrogenase-like enzyme